MVRNKIDVVVVTFEDEEQALNYKKDMDLAWPVAVDVSRELYGYFGMGRAGFFDLWNVATFRIYAREMLKGNWPKRSQADVQQRGGDVLIDPQGMVRLHHICKGPADRLSADTVLDLVERYSDEQEGATELQQLRN